MSLKKIGAILFLLSFICVIFSFCLLYISFNLKEPSNSINQLFRDKVIRSSILKYAFRLHQVGDERYQYMNTPQKPFQVTLYTTDDTLEPDTLPSIERQLIRITKKFQKMQIKTIKLPPLPESIDDETIQRLLKEYASDRSLVPSHSQLNIFVVHEYSRYPSYAGLVVDDQSLFLFKKIIRNVSDHQNSPVAAEVSTILHEFAHLLGAQHIESADCLLAERIENIDLFNRPSVFRDSYCPEDIAEINKHI